MVTHGLTDGLTNIDIYRAAITAIGRLSWLKYCHASIHCTITLIYYWNCVKNDYFDLWLRTDQQTNRPTYQLTNRPTHQPINRLIYPLTDRSTDRPTFIPTDGYLNMTSPFRQTKELIDDPIETNYQSSAWDRNINIKSLGLIRQVAGIILTNQNP